MGERGVCLVGVSAQGCVCLGGVCPGGVYTPTHCMLGYTGRCKTLPCPKLCLRAVINISILHYSSKAKKTDVAVVLDITELSIVFAY